MKNVIELLEKMGTQSINTRDSQYGELVSEIGLTDDAQSALLSGDATEIASMLDTSHKIVGFLAPAKDDDAEEQETEQEEEQKDSDSEQKESSGILKQA